MGSEVRGLEFGVSGRVITHFQQNIKNSERAIEVIDSWSSRCKVAPLIHNQCNAYHAASCRGVYRFSASSPAPSLAVAVRGYMAGSLPAPTGETSKSRHATALMPLACSQNFSEWQGGWGLSVSFVHPRAAVDA